MDPERLIGKYQEMPTQLLDPLSCGVILVKLCLKSCSYLHAYKFNVDMLKGTTIRALALKNVNAISKAFLAFHGSKTFASKNCKPHYCKKFCNSATVQF